MPETRNLPEIESLVSLVGRRRKRVATKRESLETRMVAVVAGVEDDAASLPEMRRTARGER